MENDKMNIYQRLNEIGNEIGYVAKNLNVGVGKTSYKGVGEADVLAAVKPLEKKWGIYSYPYSRKVIDSEIVETVGYDGNVKKSYFERIETTYRFVNVDNPSEYVDITSYGIGIDPADKSCGKAMTYADKYAILKAYKIMTGDDPDQTSSEENRIAGRWTPKAQDAAYRASAEVQAPATASAAQLNMINALRKEKGLSTDEIEGGSGVKLSRDMPKQDASKAISWLQSQPGKEEASFEDLPF